MRGYIVGHVLVDKRSSVQISAHISQPALPVFQPVPNQLPVAKRSPAFSSSPHQSMFI
jgi:hypothetical protein